MAAALTLGGRGHRVVVFEAILNLCAQLSNVKQITDSRGSSRRLEPGFKCLQTCCVYLAVSLVQFEVKGY